MISIPKYPTILLDLDSTICDCTHRLHFVTNKPKDFKSFYAGIPDDKPIQPLIDICNTMIETGKFNIVIVTGREKNPKTYVDTVKWLSKYDVKFNMMYMRKQGDYRPDWIIKKEILNRIRQGPYFDPQIGIDDRDSIIEMYRNEGLIALQVENGVLKD